MSISAEGSKTPTSSCEIAVLDAAGGRSVAGKASFTSSVLNLTNTVLGTGLLALPRAFSHGGIVWGLLLNMLAALLNVLSNHLIAEAQGRIGRPSNFKEIAEAAVKRFSLFVDAAVIVNALGAGCSYMIVATDSFTTVFGAGGPRWP